MSGIQGLFNKKKNKTVEKAAKEAAKEQRDDGEWLSSAPKKASSARVVTAGKAVDDYCPEIVQEKVIDSRTQMEIDETKRMIAEAQRRHQEADAAPAEDPKPAAAGAGVGGIDWRAKAEERRLREMEKNKELEFPTLAGESSSKPTQLAVKQMPIEENTATVFSSVNNAQEAVPSASFVEAEAPHEPAMLAVPEAASTEAASTEAASTEAAEGVGSTDTSAGGPAAEEESQSTAAKKAKKKKGSYMDF